MQSVTAWCQCIEHSVSYCSGGLELLTINNDELPRVSYLSAELAARTDLCLQNHAHSPFPGNRLPPDIVTLEQTFPRRQPLS